jgi:hypothetical protein
MGEPKPACRERPLYGSEIDVGDVGFWPVRDVRREP